MKQSIAAKRSPISSPYLSSPNRKLQSWINPQSSRSNSKKSFHESPSDDFPLIKHQPSPSLPTMYSIASNSNPNSSPILLLSPNKDYHNWTNSSPSRSKSSSSSRVLFDGTTIKDSSISLTSLNHNTKHVHEAYNNRTCNHENKNPLIKVFIRRISTLI